MNIIPISAVVAFVELQRRSSSSAEMRGACERLSRALIAGDARAASGAAFEVTALANHLTLSERERDLFSQIGYHWQLYGDRSRSSIDPAAHAEEDPRMSRRNFLCPFFGAACFADDETQTVGHDEPVCAAFVAANARADSVHRVSGEKAMEALLAAQREEVRKSRN